MKGLKKRRDGTWERVREAAPEDDAPSLLDRLVKAEAQIADLEEKVVKLQRSKADGKRLTDLEDKVAEHDTKLALAVIKPEQSASGSAKKEKA